MRSNNPPGCQAAIEPVTMATASEIVIAQNASISVVGIACNTWSSAGAFW